MVDFSVASEWVRRWHNFFKTSTEQSNEKLLQSWIIVETPPKILLHLICKSITLNTTSTYLMRKNKLEYQLQASNMFNKIQLIYNKELFSYNAKYIID